MRQVVLDTETTGLETTQGHRIIEIGCVELVDRKLTGNHYHQYIKPERDIDAGAQEVHGISADFLADKPVFSDIAKDFMEYVSGAELIIHNAPFDVGFINYELSLLGMQPAKVESVCTIFDTLTFARQLHPGQRNSLDALCGRYFVDNSQRDLHGALLDSEILADVFIAMTSGQTTLGFGGEDSGAYGVAHVEKIIKVSHDRPRLKIIRASESELLEHHQWVEQSTEIVGKNLWAAPTPESTE